MKKSDKRIIQTISTVVALLGCQKEEKVRTKPIPEVPMEARVMSAIITHEDSNFTFNKEYTWPPISETTKEYAALWDIPTDSQWVNAGPHVFLGIYEKHKVSPYLHDVREIDSTIQVMGADTLLTRKYLDNRDSTSERALPLDIKHLFVFIDEDLLLKPNLRIESLPKKYVSKYCRVGISNPVFSTDSLLSIAYMFSPCMEGGRTYLLKRTGRNWAVMLKTILDRSYYGEPMM